MPRSLVFLSLVCASLSGCDSVAGAPGSAGRFALDVNPPVVLEQEGLRIEILQDRFFMRRDGTATRRVRQRMDYGADGTRDTTATYEIGYGYHVEGSAIEFTSACDDTARCLPGPDLWGQIADDRMELRTRFDPDVVLTYRRERAVP